MYFTKEVQDAIVDYNLATDESLRSRIYSTRIHKALDKLAENVIHTFKFYYRDVDTMRELKHEVEVHLLRGLHLYNPERGKAYSYFTRAAMRFLMQYNKQNYKRINTHQRIDELDEREEFVEEPVNLDREEQFRDEFMTDLHDRLETEFADAKVLAVGKAVLTILLTRDSLPDLSSKTMYMYVRQFTEATPTDVHFFTRWLGQKYKEVRSANGF